MQHLLLTATARISRGWRYHHGHFTRWNRNYTIVLMSDGQNNTGQSLEDFLNFYHSQPGAETIKTFAILFGEADEKEMIELVEATGGRLFDAKATPLETIFKQIRGYQ